uniref:Secreted protein n=1 Tax=Ditylenchus dipsaci TaxID=166011 RepID=A0A915DS59_9BILA
MSKFVPISLFFFSLLAVALSGALPAGFQLPFGTKDLGTLANGPQPGGHGGHPLGEQKHEETNLSYENGPLSGDSETTTNHHHHSCQMARTIPTEANQNMVSSNFFAVG